MLHSAFFGELLGSISLILLGNGAVAGVLLKHSKSENSGWIVITSGWGFAIMISIYIAQASGSIQADLNPVITLIKYLLSIYRDFHTVFLLWIGQLLGCFIGSILVWIIYYPHWIATQDPIKKLMIFSTYPAIRFKCFNLLSEIIASFVLVIFVGSLMTLQNSITLDKPYIIGIAIWGIGLSLGGTTGYSINPFRDLAPRLAHMLININNNKYNNDWGYAWIPIIGPFIGGILGWIFITIFFIY